MEGERQVGGLWRARAVAQRRDTQPSKVASEDARDEARSVRLSRTAPFALLAVFLVTTLMTTLTQAHCYGVTIDEPLQQVYGQHVLAWYRSLGRDRSFLTAFPAVVHMPEHGGIVDAVIAALQSWFPGVDPWLMRRLASGVIGWLGVVAIALCGYELGGPWAALAASIGLWLYPRYYGAMYNNPKDVPAAVSLLFVLWATLLLVRFWAQPVRRYEIAVLLGCSLGAATAIRVTALTWFGVLAALLAGWWLIRGRQAWTERRIGRELARQGAVAAIIGVCWFISTTALWPFVWLNPLVNLPGAVVTLSHYPWTGNVLFGGVEYPATQLPATYVPTWLVIGSPPMLLALAILGMALVVGDLLRHRRIEPAAAVVALALVISLAPLLLLHPVLYDALRQFLYVVPPLILLAAFGLVKSVTRLLGSRRSGQRWLAAGLLGVTLLSYALVTADMAALSPYEYIYFSPLVGGLPGAATSYDTDYYGTCGTAAADWLSRNYQRYTGASRPTIGSSAVLQDSISRSLPADFHRVNAQPDFFIGFSRDGSDKALPTYRTIHVVAVEGVTLCVVKVKPATT